MTNFQAALQYQEMGLSVIPIKGPAYAKGETEENRYDDAKRPLIQWEGYQKKKASEDEIRAWFKKWPKANIAIVTGTQSGVCVVDVDESEIALPVLSKLLGGP